MRILIPAICQQGQVYAHFWLSTVDCLKQSMAYNSEVYRKLDQEMASKIIQQIPGFDVAKPEHQKLLADSRNLPQNTREFERAYRAESIELNFYSIGGESLLGRARNHVAQIALTEGFDKVLFIDCDEGFTWNDVVTLVKAPYPIAGGVVPLKAFFQPGSFETSLNFLPFNEDEMFFDDSIRTLKSTLRMARAKKSKWLKVAFTGTGFLCIDTSVFAKLAETSAEYLYPNPRTGMPELHWSFFDGGPINNSYLSEDWSLCERARAAGYDIMINADVRAVHVGPHVFVAG